MTAAHPPAAVSSDVLQNRYFKVSIASRGISGLRVDPSGQSRSSQNFARDLRPDGWLPGPSTRLTLRPGVCSITGLEVTRDSSVRVEAGANRPDLLQKGQTLSQTFSVGPLTVLSSVAVKLPTWHTSNSGATLVLYREGVALVSRRLKNVPDNSWQRITPPVPVGEGSYRVQISDPEGMIGWWSSPEDRLAGGEAIADGRPVGGDRTVVLEEMTEVGTGDLLIRLQGDRLRVQAHLHSSEPASAALLWRWRTSWTQSGYDVTPRAGVAFSRFFTDNQRYMPVEQLKRRTDAGLSFSGCRWIEMSGTRDASLRLSGPGLGLRWQMQSRDMSLLFSTATHAMGPQLSGSEWTLRAAPYPDVVPSEFPHFTCSDPAMERDLNRLWWERAFTYPAPAGNAAWFEWIALIRAPFAGPLRDGQVDQLRRYPMQPDGYVNTWDGIVGWPFPDSPPYDTRHADTNARFILACWRYYLWTGDLRFLESQANRLRNAMRYQLETLHGRSGLITTVSKDVTGRHRAIGDNYWDILPFGHLDAYANIVFYASLAAMQQMDGALDQTPLIDYQALRRRVHRAYDDTFWNDAAGRYIGCVDQDGVKHDYGFTFVNLEALAYGLGDPTRARRIYRWMENGVTSSGTADTYSKWVFAPRANTIHNPQWSDRHPGGRPGKTPPWWMFAWHGTPYGDQCQDGGAILYTSYFDLMSRLRYSGAENAWRRLTAIINRYRMPDRLCGGDPLFRGERPQQENPGSVGLDLPFPESGLVPCYFLYGVLGVRATPAGLEVAPHLPASLSYAGVSSVNWHGMAIGIRATHHSITVRASAAGKASTVRTFPYETGESVRVLPSDFGLSPDIRSIRVGANR